MKKSNLAITASPLVGWSSPPPVPPTAARTYSPILTATIHCALPLAEQKSYQEAEVLVEEVLAAEPDSVSGLLLRADIERQTDRLDQARADYARVTELAPDRLRPAAMADESSRT